MISRLVKYELLQPNLGTLKVNVNRSSINFEYPCVNKHVCTPYKLSIEPGVYFFECWGAKGTCWALNTSSFSIPGLGAYVCGSIVIKSTTIFYVYIGATGRFNSQKEPINGFFGGGATDVRLNASENWFDTKSLISRIMVAAGGGGSEWTNALGGNGGGLQGGESRSVNLDGIYFDDTCLGANQIGGHECPTYPSHKGNCNAYKGGFGFAGTAIGASDQGGQGGGGYYGGTSYPVAFSGSGGSSFISGHDGCNSVENDYITIKHTGHSFHYSGLIFANSKMIDGNQTMPLKNNQFGIWNQENGMFRITNPKVGQFSEIALDMRNGYTNQSSGYST